jgi:hypothetical protein
MSRSVSRTEVLPVAVCPTVWYETLLDVSEMLVRSKQTARCAECASLQPRRDYSRCCLPRCEPVFCCLAFFGFNTGVFFPGALRSRTHTLFSSQRTLDLFSQRSKKVERDPTQAPNKERPFIPALRCDGAFWPDFCNGEERGANMPHASPPTWKTTM